jgi:mannose-6-phosphate isomerase-like protein (cupin superfamily)
MIKNIKKIESFITKDGSKIREIFHPNNSSIKTMSLAEAEIPPDKTTKYHYHKKSDEIYLILQGSGVIEIEGKKRKVRENDCILIRVGTKHRIKNVGDDKLRILCSCRPPYSHEDTVLV